MELKKKKKEEKTQPQNKKMEAKKDMARFYCQTLEGFVKVAV